MSKAIGIVSFAILVALLVMGWPQMKAQTQQHGITVTWTETNNSDPATTFNVFRGTAAGAEGTTPVNATPLPATATSYFDSAVTGGTKYFYTVVAIDSLGDASAASNEISATALETAPNPPVAGTATAR